MLQNAGFGTIPWEGGGGGGSEPRTGIIYIYIYIYYTLQVMADLPNRIINWCRISYIADTTVDGRNPAPPGMYKTV